MKLNRKEILVAVVLISCLFLPSLTVFGMEERIFEQQGDTTFSDTPLSNVTIEMISSLSSHRLDEIPSTLPDSSFTVQFNITNLTAQTLNQLEIIPTTNEYGIILNPANETQNALEINESWLTQEYMIESTSNAGNSAGTLDLAIVLDQSGSMGDEIEILTNELVDVVNKISDQVPDLRVSLILFGGSSFNPYIDSDLVYPLTADIQSIVDILEITSAGGGTEPWGDALWVAQNRLDWRDNVAKLIVLITDEPNNGGELIPDHGEELYELYEDLASENFILCTIAASGSYALTLEQLEAGAEYTNGTYIVLGGDGPQTDDIPEIIGELIVYYAVELNLKIFVKLSHLNESDMIESVEKTFVILLDDLPPEIDSWVYISEDFITDEKFINILCEVKDVSETAFVDIYYKTNDISYWIIANATLVFNHSYIVTFPYNPLFTSLIYRSYAVDWLGNEILTESTTIDLLELEIRELVTPGQKKEYVLAPHQGIICRLLSDSTYDSYGLIFSKYQDNFDALVADVTDAMIILNNVEVPFQSVLIKKGHLVKASLISKDYARVIVANVIPEDLDFEQNFNRVIDVADAWLFKVDNRFSDVKVRSFVADSQLVQTSILVFNATNWEQMISGYAEVILPEEEMFILVYAEYHYGEIFISFDYEDKYTPYEHYWETAALTGLNFLIYVIPLIGLAAYILMKKRR